RLQAPRPRSRRHDTPEARRGLPGGSRASAARIRVAVELTRRSPDGSTSPLGGRNTVRDFFARVPALPPRSVPVCLGHGTLRRLVARLATTYPRHFIAVVSDRRVARLHGRSLVRSLG